MSAIRCLSAILISVAVLSTAASAAPTPTSITPQLVDAAKKEGKVIFYTSIELQTAEKIGRAFEARTGAAGAQTGP